MSNPKPTLKLKLRPANEAELPFIHLVTTAEPFFYHIDGSLISFREFLDYDIKWYVAVDDDGECYAAASFGFIDWINRSAGIGLVVLPSKRRLGVATQCLELITKMGFKTLGLHRLWASIVEDNRVVWEGMKRFGWEHCGRFRESQLLDGKWVNRVIFELINKEG